MTPLSPNSAKLGQAPHVASHRDDDEPLLPYGRQWIEEDDIQAVVRVLRGDWLTQGPAVNAFEEALAEHCGAKFAVAVSSGTAALHLACLAAGVGPGDVGITSPITFVASANCIAYCGARPTFADIDPQTVTVDPAALEEACVRHRPKVIIPVDFAGQPADLPAIQTIANRFGATVIQDAAHSLGASYEHEGRWYNVGSCAHSDMTVLSFHPVKHITTGEGGAILTNSRELYERLLRLRSHGITRDPKLMTRADGPWYYEQIDLGYNYRITDIQCALGLSQLRKLTAFVQRRRELVQRYSEQLSGWENEIQLLLEQNNRRSSYHLLVARIRGGSERRRQVLELLRQHKIHCQVHYIPIHSQPWYRKHIATHSVPLPRADTYYASCLSLPLFPGMTYADVDRVVHALNEALTR